MVKGSRKPRICKCGETDPAQFYPYAGIECKKCITARTSARQRGNHELHRARHLKRAYGLSPEQYDRMLASQSGLCALCGQPPTDEKLMVDHDHETLEVRGLIHRFCNSLLGFSREDVGILALAIRYISRFKS